MKIKLKKSIVQQIKIQNLAPYGIDPDELDYHDKITINLAQSPMEKVVKLKELLEGLSGDKRKTAFLVRDIQTWIDIKNKKDTKMRTLPIFRSALTAHLLPIEGHRIYTKFNLDSDLWLCYRVTNITYDPPSAYHQANVSMDIIYDEFGERKKSGNTFHIGNIQGKTVSEILANSNIYPETKELRENYLKHHLKYQQTFKNIGKQYLANGVGNNEVYDEDDDDDDGRTRLRYNYNVNKFQFEDNKVVVDIFREDDSNEDSSRKEDVDTGELFWEAPFDTEDKTYMEDERRGKIDEEGTKEINLEVPTHPFLTVFDLQRHLRLKVHASYVKEYVYDKTLSDKLVLSKENKDLIQILIEHKEGGFKDIVQNKTGGAIILLTGRAGVGKTLTAEVFAESKEKPLYSIQSSQLGVTPKRLEKKLMKILSRSARWNAILLIDEADVYIHERRNDINQNAIVGVFLRILEYHSSILFMTTNRPDIVDDAIASRCVARIDYKYPDKDQQKQIWRILSDVSEIKLKQEIIEEFVKDHDYCGRDIKNLLKLANLRAKSQGKEIELDHIKFVTRFNPTISESEKKKL